MAIAERELTTSDETVSEIEEAPDSEKAKRERVDLETLAPDAKVMISISVPAGMKLALVKRAEENGTPIATNYARTLLADALGYEIPDSFLERTRTGKYAGMSDEDIKAAKAADAKAKRDSVAALLKALKSDPSKLAELAAQAGIDVTNL